MRSLAVLMALILMGCGNTPLPVDNETVAVPEAVVTPVNERVVGSGINVREDRIPTPISDFSVSELGLTFTNKDGYTYYAPIERLHVKEPKKRSRFLINKGHYLLLDKGRKSHIVRYDRIDTTRKEIYLNLSRENEKQYVLPYTLINVDLRSLIGGKIGEFGHDGVRVSRGYHREMTYDEIYQLNPKVTKEDYADSKTLGKAVLEVDGWRFNVFVGYKAGNPLVIDLNGDRKIDGRQVRIHTKSEEEHIVEGI